MGKSSDLEDAAASIKRAILAVCDYVSHEATVQARKTIIVNCVKHEVDILVTILGYDPHCYIFEGKNWAEPVGKIDREPCLLNLFLCQQVRIMRL